MSPPPPPQTNNSMITATVEKTPNQRLGLSLEEDSSGRVFVTRISRTGLFAGTPLKAGHEIVMVNSIPCDGLKLRDISQIMIETDGRLTVHAISAVEDGVNTDDGVSNITNNSESYDEERPPPQVAIRSESQQQRQEQQKQQQQSMPPRRINSSISKQRSEIAPGAVEVLLDPNRAPPVRGAAVAPALQKSRSMGKPLASSNGAVEVLLDPNRAPPPGAAAATSLPKSRSLSSMIKNPLSSSNRQNRTETADNAGAALPGDNELGSVVTIVVPHEPRLGLRLQQTVDGNYVFVRRLDADSVFAGTGMRIGMRLIAVNDYDTVGLNIEEVTRILKQPRPDGVLTIMGALDKEYDPKALQEESHAVRAQQGTPENLQERFQKYKKAKSKQKHPIVRASAFKEARSQSTGLRLKETPDKRYVRIDIIQPNGLFAETQLEVDMRLLSINGMNCDGMTVKQVASMFRETQGTITVEAQHSG